MDEARPVSADLSHYLGMFRRHWWIALLATGVGLGGGAAVAGALPRIYESSTSVLVQSVDQDSNAAGGRTKSAINLDTEAQLVASGAVAVKAAQLLRSTANPIDLAKNVAVEVPANTTVLVVHYDAVSPRAAQSGSHAFAQAYLLNREETAQAGLNEQIKTLTTKIKQLTGALTMINSRLAATASGSSDRSNLESLRSNSQNQLNALTDRLNDLTTTTVGAGSIISDARLPDRPTSPNTLLDVAAGGMAGLLLGLALGFARERLDRRLRSAADVRDRAGLTVLAALNERTLPGFDDVLQPYGAGGRIFNRLRNEVLASLGEGRQVIVVTGASRGAATTLVAANLAAALARTGSDVVLIGAHLPDSVNQATPLARMLGVNPMPGLSDLLAGRITLSRALQRTARIPSLRVITTGGAATAAGLMQSQRLRDTLHTLRSQTGYVVIEAPSTSSSADAQSLASLADAAILAVELRRTRRPALLDAAEQLRRVGTPLLGAVVVPRLATVRPDEGALPAVALTPPAADRKMSQDTGVFEAGRTAAGSSARPTLGAKASSGPVRPRDAGTEDPTAVIGLAPATTESPDGSRNDHR